MNEKICNKQISIESIIECVKYLKEYKEKYDKIFEEEEEKNKDISFGEKNYQYENGNSKISYTIEFKNGKSITESEYSWFTENVTDLKTIKSMNINMYVSYYSKSNSNVNNNDTHNRISADMYFRETNVDIDINTVNRETEAHNLYSEIMSILDKNEDRYNKVIKYRKIRIQSVCIALGIILSYVAYYILKCNENSIPTNIMQYLNNKYVIILGQWFLSIVLGNMFLRWMLLMIYRPLIPEGKYAGYNYSKGRGNYVDDLDEYKKHCEVQFGIFSDAKKRRIKIEKMYKISGIVVLIQLIISGIFWCIL